MPIRGLRLLVATLVAAAALLAVALDSGATTAPSRPARVVGTFRMRATITTAVNVEGEHKGEKRWRTWHIKPQHCTPYGCRDVRLQRRRGGGWQTQLTLKRVGRGRYLGHGVFYAGLECRGRKYPHGSRVPYTMKLRVASAVNIGGVRFAKQLTAHYLNRSRSDRTICPLGPSHDAAAYKGKLSSQLPVAPMANFTFRPAGPKIAFHETSTRGSEGRIMSFSWNFGDPRSKQDSSTERNPTHRYASPGTYQVTLTIRNAIGMTSVSAHSVTFPGGPPPV